MQKRSSLESGQDEQIQVHLRIRPMRQELSKKTLKLIDRGVAFHYKDNKIHQLYFDNVFEETASQQRVFEQACLPIVRDVLRGNNGSLFVYGQTGTGKTYTMGTLESIKREDQGLIPLALTQILGHLTANKSKDEWSVCISFMQIYMEDIYDLFNPTNGKLHIRESLEQGETFVEDLVIVPIENYKQSIQLINTGLKYRKVGNQKMNELSSRSHTIFTIYVTQKISSTEYMSSTLSLIDLAGSERVKKSNSVDLRLDEAKFINTSLSSLGNVISALAQNNSQKFVPYRSSKLTRILKDSLTGRSKISVICTLDVSAENMYETYSTLLFADRCKEIRFPNQPAINIQTFQEIDQEKNLKAALEKSLQKEKQYQEIIRNLEKGGTSTASKESHRQKELNQIIESIYKLFEEMNCQLRKLLDPKKKNTVEEEQCPRVTSNVPIADIKQQLTNYARETIKNINSLTDVAFGDVKYQSQASSSKLETETLTSILLDMLRLNIKQYQTILVKDAKDSFEKEICLDEYEKEKKQEILNKLKAKKLKHLQNNFQQIWSESQHFSNPLTSLLNGIRKGDVSLYHQKMNSTLKQEPDKQFSNPKQFLKMLTRQESERKHKQMLIDDSHDEQENSDKLRDGQANGRKGEEMGDKKEEEGSLKGSKISYFQKSSPKRKKEAILQQSSASLQVEKMDSSSNEIKKLLDSLIANKAQFEEKKREI